MLQIIIFIFGLLVSLISAHLMAELVDKALKDKKKWVRMFFSLAALIVSFAIIICIVLVIMDYTDPGDGFSR